jgi:glyoxylase-like metal-dependent hydrolase (beta-lactamase superfamily II)
VAGLKTLVVAGDAVLTRDHFERARVFERSADPARARQSFADIVEIADIIVPGHDNLIVGV